MRRTLLNPADIRALDHVYLELVDHIQTLKRSEPLAVHIATPRLPSALSEAIAAQALTTSFLPDSRLVDAPDRHDLAVVRSEQRETIAVCTDNSNRAASRSTS